MFWADCKQYYEEINSMTWQDPTELGWGNMFVYMEFKYLGIRFTQAIQVLKINNNNQLITSVLPQAIFLQWMSTSKISCSLRYISGC